MMRKIRAFASAALLLAPLASGQEPDGKAGFHFSLRNLGGQTVTQDHFAESVVLVDFWGTWCPPCREAVPHLAELYAKYKQHGLEIVGLAYEKGGTAAEQAERVRKFAVENRITWTLALGDEAIRSQVKDFTGYPTLLLFRRGMVADGSWTGFSAATNSEIEARVQKALGLAKGDAADPSAEPAAATEPPEPEEKVPEGQVFRPGKSDRGFDFEVPDANGTTRKFADWRGKPVLLGLTTTWDREADRVADLLQALHAAQPGLVVLGGCVERARDEAERNATIRAFRSRKNLDFVLFAADLKFTRKVYRFAALPTLLLFDGDGVLVLREDGLAADTEARLREKIAASIGKRPKD